MNIPNTDAAMARLREAFPGQYVSIQIDHTHSGKDQNEEQLAFCAAAVIDRKCHSGYADNAEEAVEKAIAKYEEYLNGDPFTRARKLLEEAGFTIS
jgi:chromosome condensin MukBEF ATPase and DNA-binding subunit MukB